MPPLPLADPFTPPPQKGYEGPQPPHVDPEDGTRDAEGKRGVAEVPDLHPHAAPVRFVLERKSPLANTAQLDQHRLFLTSRAIEMPYHSPGRSLEGDGLPPLLRFAGNLHPAS